jgi:hypothetical protein
LYKIQINFDLQTKIISPDPGFVFQRVVTAVIVAANDIKTVAVATVSSAAAFIPAFSAAAFS